MARIRLTAARVENFKCSPGKKQEFIWDNEAPGLGVRATAGSKSYIFQGKLNGSLVRITVGDVGTWSLDEVRDRTSKDLLEPGARQEARRLRAILDQGRDPREVKAETTAADVAKRKRNVQRQTPTLTIWSDYCEARSTSRIWEGIAFKKIWGDRHTAEHDDVSRVGGQLIVSGRGRRKEGHDRLMQGMLRPILMLPLSEITSEVVDAWLDEESPIRPARTRGALAMLTAFLNACAKHPAYRDMVHLDAIKDKKARLPQANLATFDACLQREQLKTWFDHVNARSSFTMKAYLQTLLLVGARRDELTTLLWEDVNMQWKSMTIRDKVEGERTIPLTPYVESLLLELQRLNNLPPTLRQERTLEARGQTWAPSPWVFASRTSESGHLESPLSAHHQITKAAGLPPLTLHDLRRSFITLSEWVEAPTGVVAQITGHKPSATAEKHYHRRPLDLLRMWHVKIEKWMLEQAGIQQPDPQTL
ncbi:DUF4102 domain-containing protein [Candidimonas sp. SYP-B2681]|uniref:integrase family protein n=1 Tax=Candidimonas sp. SYP-B2681 TaxID=2497686 RepID=UPI000F860917|nr:integrase family protein [Candidimonas sp. SYP-B2681]RTZ47486.1 DUF4102 domain-containing protein [Candidimonas sp. SYP-B2681]